MSNAAGFAPIHREVLQVLPHMKSSTLKVYTVLADTVSKESGRGVISIEEIMTKTGLVRSTVCDSLRTLTGDSKPEDDPEPEVSKLKLVNRERNYQKGGGRDRNLYHLRHCEGMREKGSPKNEPNGSPKNEPYVDVVGSMRPKNDPTMRPKNGPAYKDTRTRNKNKKYKDASASSCQSSPRNDRQAVEVVFEFPLSGKGQTYRLPPSKMTEYRQTFPGVDVEQELRLAWQWLQDNPRKRKTRQGMPQFLSGWLKRSRDSIKPTQEQEPKPYRPARDPVLERNNEIIKMVKKAREQGFGQEFIEEHIYKPEQSGKAIKDIAFELVLAMIPTSED